MFIDFYMEHVAFYWRGIYPMWGVLWHACVYP
jgi:hypothetical protein